jgi:hypothetical protein
MVAVCKPLATWRHPRVQITVKGILNAFVGDTPFSEDG